MANKEIQIEVYHFQNFKMGDENAYEYFFKKYFNRILGFTKQFVYDADDAKEITQDVFIKLWTSRHKIREADGIQSFLYKMARNKSLNFIRHKKVRSRYASFYLQQQESGINMEVLNSIEFDTMVFKELEELINESISELPEKCREVFVKKRFENKRNKEIATEMGITVKAVEANMTRALKFLRLRLSSYLSCLLVYLFFSLFFC